MKTLPNKTQEKLFSVRTVAIIFLIFILVIWFTPYFQIKIELNNLVKTEVMSSSKYCLSYSLGGQYGSILNIKLSDDFDSLLLPEQSRELKKIMDKYDGSRMDIVRKYKPKIIYSADTSFLPDIIANTTKNRYEFSSVDSIRVNGELYLYEDVISGSPFSDSNEIDHIQYNPPIEVFLISTNRELNFLLAADTTYDLMEYEMYSNWRSSFYSNAKATKLLDQDKVYFLFENTKVLLLEYYGDFAKIELTEGQLKKREGDICWVRKSNIRLPAVP